AIEVLREATILHDRDHLLELLQKIELLLQGSYAYGQDQDAYEIDIRLEACLVKYRSLYPEVRAVRSPFDDPETPVETFRSYFLGIVWVVIGSFVNETPGEPRQP
ncbi:hypothetical protein POJ06DRAFT_183873, partial [Lipomyces tetrasporus]